VGCWARACPPRSGRPGRWVAVWGGARLGDLLACGLGWHTVVLVTAGRARVWWGGRGGARRCGGLTPARCCRAV